jgi:hypothetical protein
VYRRPGQGPQGQGAGFDRQRAVGIPVSLLPGAKATRVVAIELDDALPPLVYTML